MSVAIALAVGAGLAVSFSEAYVSAWLGFGGWPVKLAFLVIVMGLQLRGASEAVGLTVAVGVAALVILVAFCLFMAPEFQSARLFSTAPGGARSLLPHGLAGAARCIPFALFLFLGVEQSAHAAAEMRDMARNMPKALATAIGVAFVIGICVLLIATGGTGADRLAAVLPPGAGRVPAARLRRRQCPSGAGGRRVSGRRHRAGNGGISAEQRHGRVHLPDQRFAHAHSCRVPAPSAPGAGVGADLPRARRFTDRGRGPALVARRHGVLLPTRGTCVAGRHCGDRPADRAVRVAEAGAVAGLMNSSCGT